MKTSAIVFGILAAVQVLGARAGAGGVVEPGAIAFGPVRAGDVAVDTVWVQNPGPADFLIESHTLSGPAYDLLGAPFSGAPIVLAPDASLAVPIRFSPPDTGTFSGRLDLITGDGSVAVDMTGRGALEVVVINEILADPPSGAAGDANGDGHRDSSDDEFVELLNTGLRPISLSGWQLCDRGTPEGRRFTFPEGTWIGPGERVVLFGGGVPTGIGGQVFTDDGRIGGGLSNSGDAVYLIDPAGPDTVARADYGAEGGKNQSVVRHPEGSGAFVQHSLFPGNGASFSPGAPRTVLSQIRITPADTSVALGETVRFTAEGAFPDGSARVLEDEVTWTVSDSSVLALSGREGEGRGLGTVLVTAYAGGVASEAARVEVVAPEFTRLSIAPADTLVLVGDEVMYTVAGAFSDGSRERIEEGLLWATADSSVAYPDEANSVVARGPGRTTLSATLDGLFATASLQVAEEGDLNADGVHDILDAIRTVHLILEEPPPATPFERRASDLNGDGEVDILDLAGLIRRILGQPPGGAKAALPGTASWQIVNGTVLRMEAPVALLAVFLELEGPVLGLRIDGNVNASVFSRRREKGTLRALICTFEDRGPLTRDGVMEVQMLSEWGAGEVRVTEIRGVDLWGAGVPFREAQRLPLTYRLSQNHPNPFNAATLLRYRLPQGGDVVLRIFSAIGQEVIRLVDGPVPPGEHRVLWNGRDRYGRPVSSGVYICRLEAGNRYRTAIKMVLLK